MKVLEGRGGEGGEKGGLVVGEGGGLEGDDVDGLDGEGLELAAGAGGAGLGEVRHVDGADGRDADLHVRLQPHVPLQRQLHRQRRLPLDGEGLGREERGLPVVRQEVLVGRLRPAVDGRPEDQPALVPINSRPTQPLTLGREEGCGDLVSFLPLLLWSILTW